MSATHSRFTTSRPARGGNSRSDGPSTKGMFSNLLPIDAQDVLEAWSGETPMLGDPVMGNGVLPPLHRCSRNPSISTPLEHSGSQLISHHKRRTDDVDGSERRLPSGDVETYTYRGPSVFPTHYPEDEHQIGTELPLEGDSGGLQQLAHLSPFGLDTTLAISGILLSIGLTVLSDGTRSSSVAVGESTADYALLTVSTILTASIATVRIYSLWSNIGSFETDARGHRTTRPLRRTLIDIAAVYVMTLVAFGNAMALAGLSADDDPGSQKSELFPGSPNRLLMRLIDALYIITFVATGIGFPNGGLRLTAAARSVAWACALLVSTFIGKLLVATALTAKLNAGPCLSV